MKKVVIVGGHLTPALAIIEELNRKVEIVFLGRKYSTEGSANISAEYQIIRAKKIKFRILVAGRFTRKFTKYTLMSLLKLPIGFIQSFLYLMQDRPAIVVSFGGYLSTPVIFSAWLLGIPSVTHEQSATAGMASKINSLFVEKIFLAWPSSAYYFPKDKTEVIGNPMRRSVFIKNTKNKKINNFLKNSKKLIYVTGGNQGSHFINNLIYKSKVLTQKYKIIHQVGTVNFNGDHQKAESIKSRNYLHVTYIHATDLGAVLAKSALVISRSGANIVWEMASLALISILIPLPFSAAGEQLANAKILEHAGTARIIRQNELNEKKLINEIENIFKTYSEYKNKAIMFQKSLPTNAAVKFTAYILSYT